MHKLASNGNEVVPEMGMIRTLTRSSSRISATDYRINITNKLLTTAPEFGRRESDIKGRCGKYELRVL